MKNVIGFSCMLKCKQQYEYAEKSTLEINVRNLITGFTDGTQYSKGTWVYFILIVLSKLVWRKTACFFFAIFNTNKQQKLLRSKAFLLLLVFFLTEDIVRYAVGRKTATLLRNLNRKLRHRKHRKLQHRKRAPEAIWPLLSLCCLSLSLSSKHRKWAKLKFVFFFLS